MIKQCFWVLMTLVLRPGMWLMLAGVVLFASVFPSAFGTGTRTLLRPKIAPYSSSIVTVAALEAADPAAVQYVQMGLLARDAAKMAPAIDGRRVLDVYEKQMFDRIAAWEQVEQLSTGDCFNWRVKLERVGKLHTLKALQLGVTADEGGIGDLMALSQLQNLEVLDLDEAAGPKTSLMALQHLPRLKTLALNRVDSLTDERLAEIAGLPHLKTLYLPDLEMDLGVVERLGVLNQSPGLRILYVPVGLGDRSFLGTVREKLPEVRVYCGDYQDMWWMAIMPPLMAGMMLSFLGMHAAAWFSGPAVQLVPGYQSVHRGVTWGLAGLAGLIITAAIAWETQAVLPALALVATLTLSSSRTYLSSGLSFAWFSRVIHAGLMMGFCMIPILAMNSLTSRWVEAYAYGEVPAITYGLLLFSVVLLVDNDRRMLRFGRARIAQNLPAFMTQEDFKQDIEFKRHVTANAVPTGWWPQPPKPKAQWLRLVLIGGMVLYMGGGSIKSMGMSLLNTESTGTPFSFTGVLMPMQLVFFVLMIFVVRWRQQFPLLPTLMTRPPERRQHINRFFCAVGKDFSRLWPLPVLAVAVGVFLNGGFVDAWWFAAVSPGLMMVGLIALGYAITLLLLPLPVWQAVLVGMAGAMVLFSAVMVQTVITRGSITAGGMFVSGAALLLIAFLVLALARHRYEQIEWGRV